MTKPLDCKCGDPAGVWYVNGWAMVGCRDCGIAASAYENLKQAITDWNNIQKFTLKKVDNK